MEIKNKWEELSATSETTEFRFSAAVGAKGSPLLGKGGTLGSHSSENDATSPPAEHAFNLTFISGGFVFSPDSREPRR